MNEYGEISFVQLWDDVPEETLTLCPLPAEVDHKLGEHVDAHVDRREHHEYKLAVHSDLICNLKPVV